ncbi:TetR family transcriptional regulator C-terminal domain-containing protein [Psychrobacter sp.]|uniref:TetR family transcriptional regulator C-terminal domain-containing protein n=1 Tax=Psychrobacter sp. TaxID=56811 RepID=UPI0025D7A58E|nr:TetR family transcriptional regulator C-terminal domain-containing protein [Psychrobacter sp.]
MAKLVTDESKNTRTHQEIRAENERAILKAAEAVFVAHGLKGATMQAIADLAGIPKANVHYYYQSKKKLYIAVLTSIVEDWNTGLEDIHEDSDPKQSLETFIRLKLDSAFNHPNHHKLFAVEVINGAPYLHQLMTTKMNQWAERKSAVIKSWYDQGKISINDPLQLLILIWTTTQRYAEFDTEILNLFGKDAYDDEDKKRVAEFLIPFILRGCGL